MASAALFCFIVISYLALISGKDIQDEVDDYQDVGPEFKLILRVIDHCEKHKNAMQCLKMKALKFVDRAIKTDEITVMDGVSLVQTEDAANNSRHSKAEEINDSMKVDDVLAQRVVRFFESHAVQINMQKVIDGKLMEVGKFFQEGRGKHYKKLMGPIILGLMWKAGLLALSFKGIALLAGKAFLIANIALVLASVLGLKKLFSDSGHHEKVTYEVVKAPHVSHGYTHSASSPASSHSGWESSGGYAPSGSSGHYRSMDVAESKTYPDAFVYHAQIPSNVQNIVVPRPAATSQVLVGARNTK